MATSKKSSNSDEKRNGEVPLTPTGAVDAAIRDDDPISDTEYASERWKRIQQRAYELAEQRGFGAGAELDDWLQAEKEEDEKGARQ